MLIHLVLVSIMFFNNFQVFRHGDRTPSEEELYPTLAYNPIYESLGYGQLTEVSTRYILMTCKMTLK